jgi:class 3 adenylate cyclase
VFHELAEEQGGRVGKMGLRVAVNTGEVVASDTTEIIGDPVNVAARLQEQGHDGDVVIGESTHRLVARGRSPLCWDGAPRRSVEIVRHALMASDGGSRHHQVSVDDRVRTIGSGSTF